MNNHKTPPHTGAIKVSMTCNKLMILNCRLILTLMFQGKLNKTSKEEASWRKAANESRGESRGQWLDLVIKGVIEEKLLFIMGYFPVRSATKVKFFRLETFPKVESV